MPIGQLQIGNSKDVKAGSIEITMRGGVNDIVHVLSNGMPEEMLVQLSEALEEEMRRRSNSTVPE